MKKREKRFELRLDEFTRKLMIKNACEYQKTDNPNLSEYIRFLITSDTLNYKGNDNVSYSPYDMIQKVNLMEREINRVGNNINQITRHFNSGFFVENEKQQLLEYMDELEKRQVEIKRIVKEDC